MADERTTIQQTIEKLKEKQEQIDSAWRKTGNRPLLDFFVDIMPKALHCERCSIFILDPQKDNVWVECGTGVAEMEITVPKQGSMVGEVIATGRTIIRNNLEDMSGAHGWVDSITGFRTRNAICVPIFGVNSQQVVGAIQMLNTRDGKRGFGDEDKAMLERLGVQIEMNIENLFLKQEWARISQELSRRIKKLESDLKKAG